jgi:HEAT repeat protein
MIDLLKDSSPERRIIAAQTLGKLSPYRDSVVTAALRRALDDREARVRIKAALALYQVDRKTADQSITVLIKALNDRNPGVRLEAISTIGEIGPAAAAALPAIREATRDEASMVRMAAGRILDDIEDYWTQARERSAKPPRPNWTDWNRLPGASGRLHRNPN